MLQMQVNALKCSLLEVGLDVLYYVELVLSTARFSKAEVWSYDVVIQRWSPEIHWFKT